MSSRSLIHQVERRELRGRWFIALAALLVIALLASTWVGLFTFLGVNTAWGAVSDLERQFLIDTDGLFLELPDVSQTSRIFTETGVLLAELHDGRNSEPTLIEDVPDHVVNAVLAAEDQKFFEHSGVDFAAIVQAALDNIRGIRRGGSTITQQVVKQQFVGDEVTFQRKLDEALIAAELERQYTKEQILEFYLNSVYFGASAWGIQTAAEEYFRKDLNDLTIGEAATLGVLIRNPSFYNPRRWPDRVEERRNNVLNTMAGAGFIEPEEAERAKDEPLEISPPAEFEGPADHVVAEVKRQLLNDPRFTAALGATSEERKRAVFGCPASDTICDGGGGLRIVTTLDLDLQLEANTILENWLPLPDDPEESTPTGAIATVETDTGAIRVMASGLPFDVEQYSLATQGRRNPGSAFKPFTLVAALESGVSLNSYWDARSPTEIECPYPCGPGGSKIWRVRNAGGGGGGRSLYNATIGSVNAVYAQVAVDVGPARIAETSRRMGINSPLAEVPSITLGSSAVTPLEMASAYSNFSTNGVWAEPYLIERIETVTGEIVWEHSPAPRQVVDAAVIAAARRPMEIIPVSGTAPRANLGIPQAGKTGTHQSFREAWFVGVVPQYSTAVWVGFPDEQEELRNVDVNVYQQDGTYRPTNLDRVFGGSVPAPIWKQFMEIVLADVPVADFPEDPEGIDQYFRKPSTTVPFVEGFLRGDAVDLIYQAHLSPEVVEVNSLEPKDTVLTQLPLAGETTSQGAKVTIEVSTGLPPEGPLPNLVNLTVPEVIAVLTNFESESGVGLNFTVQFQPVGDPALVDRVIATNPPPGTTVVHGSTIVLTVGTPPADD